MNPENRTVTIVPISIVHFANDLMIRLFFRHVFTAPLILVSIYIVKYVSPYFINLNVACFIYNYLDLILGLQYRRIHTC